MVQDIALGGIGSLLDIKIVSCQQVSCCVLIGKLYIISILAGFGAVEAEAVLEGTIIGSVARCRSLYVQNLYTCRILIGGCLQGVGCAVFALLVDLHQKLCTFLIDIRGIVIQGEGDS